MKQLLRNNWSVLQQQLWGVLAVAAGVLALLLPAPWRRWRRTA